MGGGGRSEEGGFGLVYSLGLSATNYFCPTPFQEA